MLGPLSVNIEFVLKSLNVGPCWQIVCGVKRHVQELISGHIRNVCDLQQGLHVGGGHRYLDTWIPKICQVSKKKVSKSIHEYPKVSIFVSFFVDQSHPLNQLSTSSLEF